MSFFCVIKIKEGANRDEVKQVLASMLGAAAWKVKLDKRKKQLPSKNFKVQFKLRTMYKYAGIALLKHICSKVVLSLPHL